MRTNLVFSDEFSVYLMVQEAENINGISNWPLKIFGAEPPPAQNPGYAAMLNHALVSPTADLKG